MLFRDIRKFGKVFLIEKGEVSVFFERLGLEPWTPDYNLKAFLQNSAIESWPSSRCCWIRVL